MKTFLVSTLFLLTLSGTAQDYSLCFAGHCENGWITLSELVGVKAIEVNQLNPDMQADISAFSLSVDENSCTSKGIELSAQCSELLTTAAIGSVIKLYEIGVIIEEPGAGDLNIPELILTVVDNP